MGKQKNKSDPKNDSRAGPEVFKEALRRQLADRQRVVRVFDVGGTGVKTATFSTSALAKFLSFDALPVVDDGEDPAELQWIEAPLQLGMAPGEDGFASWLCRALPSLQREVDDQRVAFGVSTAGDVEHSTGLLHDWWSGGGHPRSWGDGKPRSVAELMGLPSSRTFILHDGSAHLIGCSRCAVPPTGLACFALGTGIGFGLSDSSGAAVDSSSPQGARSHLLNGTPLSGAPYTGIWRQWLARPDASNARVDEVMAKEFAGEKRPWRMPWVSLVLGRRGMELAEAAHGCSEPDASSTCATFEYAEVAETALAGETGNASAMSAQNSVDGGDPREPAVRAYGEQWLHFLHTQFVPQFASATRRHHAERLCFSGGVAEMNWPILREVLVESGSERLRPLPSGAAAAAEPPTSKRGRSTRARAAETSCVDIQVLPVAPQGAALIGAGIYALAGMGGAAMSIWSS